MLGGWLPHTRDTFQTTSFVTFQCRSCRRGDIGLPSVEHGRNRRAQTCPPVERPAQAERGRLLQRGSTHWLVQPRSQGLRSPALSKAQCRLGTAAGSGQVFSALNPSPSLPSLPLQGPSSSLCLLHPAVATCHSNFIKLRQFSGMVLLHCGSHTFHIHFHLQIHFEACFLRFVLSRWFLMFSNGRQFHRGARPKRPLRSHPLPSAAGLCRSCQRRRVRQHPARQGQSLLCVLGRGLHPGTLERLSRVHTTCPAGTNKRPMGKKKLR